MSKNTSELIDDGKERCGWSNKTILYQKYHDDEWGTPVHDEIKHFEFLLLETMQAGLSWYTILQRREGYRQAFVSFDPEKVALFDKEDVERLMQDTRIIRNRLKIEAAINNARQFIQIQKEFGSFDQYIWSFANNTPVINNWQSLNQIPVTTELSDKVAKDLKNRGFKFVGSTTIYAHLQAIGIVNDHLISCWRRKENEV